MSKVYRDESRPLIAGIWLVGLGLLLASRQFWPGILFLAGATVLVQVYYHPERRNASRVGIVLILVALWALMRLSIPFLLVAFGVWMIFSAIVATPTARKPYVDQTLD